jgi:hypothetical protein
MHDCRCPGGRDVKLLLATGKEIPNCLWTDLVYLKELYLTGNRFIGNIESFSLNNITHLALGYNRFYGSIPSAAFRGKAFELLDLSFNRFTGLLDFDIWPLSNTSDFRATINRFSGRLNTDSLNRFSNLDILAGNTMSSPAFTLAPVGIHFMGYMILWCTTTAASLQKTDKSITTA